MATEQEHENRIMGGYKAALHNPNVSDEAKHHAAEALAAHRALAEGEISQGGAPGGDEHQDHVIRGYKATLTNPNTSAEAKAHAREKLSELGAHDPPSDTHEHHHRHEAHPHEHQPGPHAHAGHGAHDAQHEHHVLGGYKATLANPNTSEEAKAHAREMLAKAGERDREHEQHVMRGYKGILSNANVSEDAKAHAREYLKEHGADV